MNINVRALYVVLLGVTASPAFSASGVSPAPGEAGFTMHYMPGTKTRGEVLKELAEWRSNPVTADGWRDVGGDVGWSYVGAPPTSKTRHQVLKELESWRRNPVSADGWREAGSEPGWVYEGDLKRGP